VTEFLNLENLLALAADIGAPGIRDIGLLDAAAHRPQTRLNGSEAYPGIHEKAAVLLESITRNHPLVDGNKRLGWLAVYVFYGLNDLYLDAPDDAAYTLVIAVATGAVDYHDAAQELERWVTPAQSRLP